MINNIILDFDSTIINAESIELIVEKALLRVDKKERKKRQKRLVELTYKATNGEIPFSEALRERFSLADITAQDVRCVAESILNNINPRVRETVNIFKQHHKNLYIFSVGLKEVVLPVAKELGIPKSNVFANIPSYDERGFLIGIDEKNPLSLSMGKVYIAEQLKKDSRLHGGTAVVGDGISDLSLRKNNLAEMFVYFSGTRLLEEVRQQADFTVDQFDRLLPLFFSNDELSHETTVALFEFPEVDLTKKQVIILLENIHSNAEQRLAENGFVVRRYAETWDGRELCKRIEEAHVIGIRSRTKITGDVIKCSPNLLAIGAYCIGINQVDLDTAAALGIPVFNAPYSNTRSVAELVVGEIIMLMRRIPEKSAAAHKGHWLKGASGSQEIRGKTAGIIGYGRIGTQVSILLENLGMSVLFHDIVDKLPLGNAKRAGDLYDLLKRSDVVTLHVPDTTRTRNMIGKREIEHMKKGACLVNTSRGKVVDLVALRRALDEDHIAGAAIDVFPEEPSQPEDVFVSPLQNSANVILSPHIGGSTKEAQENIAEYVSGKIQRYLTTGSTIGSVNFPEVDLPRIEGTHRILHVHSNVPGVLAKINDVFARRNINVEGQILQTRGEIGYLMVDVNSEISDQVTDLMKSITETIRVRRIV